METIHNIEKIRSDFPILSQQVFGCPMVYFDNAATTHKPLVVIDAISEFYTKYNANVHRGAHFLSMKASEMFENARSFIARQINAQHSYEIIFTRGTTESVNLVASTFGRMHVGKGDEVIISHIEHHSNIVPWQMLCNEKQAVLRIIPVLDSGELDFDGFLSLLSSKTKLLAITHVSNSLGTIIPVENYIAEARLRNIPVLLDGAQAMAHLPVDVQQLGCDFYCFSGHKTYGPTGIGILYGKEEHLQQMPPWQGGGEMIKDVSFEKTIYNDIPFKFEAGTPHVAGAIGLERALGYLNSIGWNWICSRENALLQYLNTQLQSIEGIQIVGTASDKAPVVSFLIDKIHPYDAGLILDRLGIAVRTGNHCTQPVMDRFKVPGTIRASLAFYNTHEEIDRLIVAIEKVKQMLS